MFCKFGLGYVLMGRDIFSKVVQVVGYKKEMFEKVGLIKNDCDFFCDCVMFFICNLSGKVVGFGGCIF